MIKTTTTTTQQGNDKGLNFEVENSTTKDGLSLKTMKCLISIDVSPFGGKGVFFLSGEDRVYGSRGPRTGPSVTADSQAHKGTLRAVKDFREINIRIR